LQVVVAVTVETWFVVVNLGVVVVFTDGDGEVVDKVVDGMVDAVAGRVFGKVADGVDDDLGDSSAGMVGLNAVFSEVGRVAGGAMVDAVAGVVSKAELDEAGGTIGDAPVNVVVDIALGEVGNVIGDAMTVAVVDGTGNKVAGDVGEAVVLTKDAAPQALTRLESSVTADPA